MGSSMAAKRAQTRQNGRKNVKEQVDRASGLYYIDAWLLEHLNNKKNLNKQNKQNQKSYIKPLHPIRSMSCARGRNQESLQPSVSALFYFSFFLFFWLFILIFHSEVDRKTFGMCRKTFELYTATSWALILACTYITKLSVEHFSWFLMV